MKDLLPFCRSERQTIIIETLIEEGSQVKAADKLGTNTRSIRKVLKRVKDYAATRGHAPDHDMKQVAPEGYHVKGTSTLYDEEGKPKLQWVKTNKDAENIMESMIEVWTEFAHNIPKAKLTPIPKYTMSDLLCDYTIGDAHIGMYAWAREAGDDWNLEKGVDILRKGANHLVESAPPAETAFILDVGDFFHADNQSNETSHSGNKLDVDGRWAKVTEAGMQCICDLIDLALQKHKKVIYRSVIGNHNEHSAVMLSIAIKMKYSNEPRLAVLDSPAIHNYYQFGVNLLADSHGHTVKPDRLPLLMATDVPKMWAETTTRIWRTGHVHHESVKEYSGATVVTYRTMTPKDSWHAGAGYRSNRDMRCTIYHRENGQVGMNIVNPTMLGYN